MQPKDGHKYDDIIGSAHPVSLRHARMPNRDRAAQFAPFAALTGFDGEIAEASRLTEAMAELSESRKDELNGVLCRLQNRLSQQPEVSVTYFLPDLRKQGGAYLTAVGRLKKIDTYGHSLILTEGTFIPISHILDIQEIE